MVHSTKARTPRKPRANFPLTPRGDGRWCKKVKGIMYYFTGTAEEAEDEYLRRKANGMRDEPRGRAGGPEVGELCNEFLTAKTRALRNREIAPVTFNDYHTTTDRIVAAFGKRRLVSDLTATDFSRLRESLSKTLDFVALGNAVQRVRGVFKFGFENQLISTPVVYGSEFKPPSKKVRRKQRNERPIRLFDAAQLKSLIDNAGVTMKAMILLGVNAALGNSDVAHLPIKALDLDGGWLNFPRPKTGIKRRVPLWPETVEALQKVLAKRPKPKGAAEAGVVFVTTYGPRWDQRGRFTGEVVVAEMPAKEEEKRAKTIGSNKAITKEFKKVAVAAGIDRTFYDLRHTFRTIAGGAKDVEATRAIMGHVNDHVEDDYIENVDDTRLVAVTEHVRTWLYQKPAKRKKSTANSKPAARWSGAPSGSESPQLRVVG